MAKAATALADVDLEAPAPEATEAPEATGPENPDYLLEFEVDGLEKPVQINLERIPDAIRLHLLKNAAKGYVTNRVSTAEAKTKKANEPFTTYKNAQDNDPLQTVVPKPEGTPAATDYPGITTRAIEALYAGELGKRGGGTKKERVIRDPLTTLVTRVVVNEVYQKARETDKNYKYPTAQKVVGQNGIEYLNKRIEAMVAEGGDRKAIEAFVEAKYILPQKQALGMVAIKGVPKDMSVL